MTTDDINSALSQFSPISLDEMKGIRLMNRVDTKYVTTKHRLLELLRQSCQNYRVQVVDGERLIDYRTIYLDTLFHDMYMAHQNGRRVREKIRVRTYMSSQLTFLEVKNKDNHGRTDKKRIRVNKIESLKEDGGADFLQIHSWYRLDDLLPQLRNTFRRITLVDKAKTERLTIDMDISFENLMNDKQVLLDDIVVVELKRDGRKPSDISQLLHRMHIREENFSKYCIGQVLTDPMIKHNRFKRTLMDIEKINKNN